jgi:Gluconate 2-dehydrogenase subunit 3
MDRRHAITHLTLAAGGLITLPFWMTACHLSDTTTHFSSFSAAEQGTLAGMVDAIIPAGGVWAPGTCGTAAGPPGALAVGVDKFLQKLIDDCYESHAKESVRKQLAALDEAAKSAYGHSFAAGTPEQRQVILRQWAASGDKDQKDFLTQMKSETIRGFNTSQKVMEDYLHYKVAPGHYYGCIDIKA